MNDTDDAIFPKSIDETIKLASLIKRAKLVMLVMEDDTKAALGRDVQEMLVSAFRLMAGVQKEIEKKENHK